MTSLEVPSSARLTHLKQLEAESIHILREVAAEFARPVMLYSIGKDSQVLVRLALKAFHPAPLPFPLLHVDTTWKFREMYTFRDWFTKEHGLKLLVHKNEKALAEGINPFDHTSQKYTHAMKTQGLLQALEAGGFDAAIGGARRDEEKSRAKERVYSFRDRAGQWDPKNQRPELWNLYNGRIDAGESIRVFPLSNWTELDVWQYAWMEKVPLVPLYFAKERPVVNRNGNLIMVDDERMPLRPGEKVEMMKVRFRTLGCYPLSGAVRAEATTVPEILREMLTSRQSERQGRVIDHDEEGSMEMKKREGYFKMTAPEPTVVLDVEQYLAQHEQKELVRFVVVGSVDDGKSTFIGRLLYETNGLYDDQIAQVKRASKQGGDEIDFSLFTDGLKAEREQAITIDVAYRYFSTPKRKYIIADTPGHTQYTRNMATGASTADVAIIMVDARYGLLPQGRRHAYIASLLGIPELAVAVNKMDLVAYDEATFERLKEEFGAYARQLGFRGVHFFPVSARMGDNVVTRSAAMPWYSGDTVLEFLEKVTVARQPEGEPWRFPVQYVLRPHLDYRGFAGQLASGSVRVDDEVMVLPSGTRTRVKAIDTYDGPRQHAAAPQSVVIRLADETDVSRGDLLVRPAEAPHVSKRLDATVVWLSERPLDPARDYLLKHTTRTVPARVDEVRWRTDLTTLEHADAQTLGLNDIGRLTLKLSRPIMADPYTKNRGTGAFILIDALTNATVAAGVVESSERALTLDDGAAASQVTRDERAKRLGHGPAVLFVDRPSEDEARAFAYALERAAFDAGLHATVTWEAGAALTCADAGLVTVVVAKGERGERDRLQAALRASGHRVLSSGEDTVAELVAQLRKAV